MATVTGIINGTGQEVTITIPTVRIPEVPKLGDPIEDADLVLTYDDSEQKTSYRPLGDIRTYIGSGSGSDPVAPTVQGSDVEIIVDETNISGDNRVLVTALQNKTYKLNRVGYGPLLSSQFTILPSGGFDLVDDKVRIGDVFFAETYSPVSTAPGGSTVVASLVNGIVLITDDVSLNSTHLNKSLHVSNPTKNTVITLFDIADAPNNLIIPIETTISNGYMTKVQSKLGQNIYVDGEAITYLWLGSNEFLWLLRGGDGWYILKASESIFLAGQPLMDYVERPNTKEAKGQLVARSEVPRLIDFLTANPSAVVSDGTWTGDDTKQGKFSWGDGSSTIRMPNHQNRVYRALNNIGFTDELRPDNSAGTLQADKVGPISGSVKRGDSYSGDGYELDMRVGGGQAGNAQTPVPVDFTGVGTETIMKNVGMIPLIRI